MQGVLLRVWPLAACPYAWSAMRGGSRPCMLPVCLQLHVATAPCSHLLPPPSSFLSVLPTYDVGPYTAGKAAPILLGLFRTLQARKEAGVWHVPLQACQPRSV